MHEMSQRARVAKLSSVLHGKVVLKSMLVLYGEIGIDNPVDGFPVVGVVHE